MAGRIPIEYRFPLDLGDIRINKFKFEATYQADATTGCWIWRGGRHRQGYGMVGAYRNNPAGKIMMTTHRASWRIYRGDPGSLNVMHVCDNYLCVNPDHLRLGTQMETIRNRPRNSPRAHRRSPYNESFRRPRRQNWDYTWTEEQIQFLRTHTPEQIRQAWNLTTYQANRWRVRARYGFHWLAWPPGSEEHRPQPGRMGRRIRAN